MTLVKQGYFLFVPLRGKAPPQFFEEMLRAGREAPCPQHLFYSFGVGGRKQSERSKWLCLYNRAFPPKQLFCFGGKALLYKPDH